MSGRVYAVDVDVENIERLRALAENSGHAQIHPVLPSTGALELEKESVELLFFCHVYHHLENRRDYFEKARALLRPGGRVAIIELENLPWYYFHGAHQTEAIVIREEMEAAGYVRVKAETFLEHHSFQIFE